MRKIIASVVMGGLLAGGVTTTASAGDLIKTYNSIDQGSPGWNTGNWIDGTQSPMSIDLFVDDFGIIESFDLVTAIEFSHTWIGDLSATLEHVDTGTKVVILNRPGLGPFSSDDFPGGTCCGNSSNIAGNYDWADTVGGAFWWPGAGSPAASPVAYDPRGYSDFATPLSDFAGEEKHGTWRFTLYDGAFGDLGAIAGFEMTITNVPAPGALALLGLAGLVSRRRRRRS